MLEYLCFYIAKWLKEACYSMNRLPKIKTQRCILDGIKNEDLSILQQIFHDDATKRQLRELNDLVSSEEGIKQFISSFSCYISCNEGFLWGIYLDSKLVGFIGIMDMSINPTLFYAMHPDYRSQGIMKECIMEVMNFISKSACCNFMQSEVYKDNFISIHLLLSVNFEIISSDIDKVFLKTTIKAS